MLGRFDDWQRVARMPSGTGPARAWREAWRGEIRVSTVTSLVSVAWDVTWDVLRVSESGCTGVHKVCTSCSLMQRAAKARLYKLPLDAAVQSRRPDLIEFGGLPTLALPRDKLAVGTVRRSLQRPRAGDGTVTAVYVNEKYSKKYCWKYIQ